MTRAADELQPTIEHIQAAIDHVHWLGVHRVKLGRDVSRTAGHLEELLLVARRMTWDLQGMVSRAEMAQRVPAEPPDGETRP